MWVGRVTHTYAKIVLCDAFKNRLTKTKDCAEHEQISVRLAAVGPPFSLLHEEFCMHVNSKK